MTLRIKNKSLGDDQIAMTPDRSELKFLERNLEELSRAHKKVCIYFSLDVLLTEVQFRNFIP